jgi:hypothetical protein
MKNLLGCCIFLAVPLTIIVGCASLNYSGFCFDKNRYLSDEEIFRMQFDSLSKQKTVPIKTKDKGTQRYEQVKYESFEQFMEMNPNCCAIDPGGPYEVGHSYFFDRITGYDSGRVLVSTFALRYLDENGEQKSQEITTEYVLQNCGKRRGS